MKKIIILYLFVAICSQAGAQNDFRISHFMMNELSYNPAFAGSCRDIQATLWVREQWTGFSNAPSSQTLNGQTYLPKYGGVGVSIMNDRLGFEKNLHFKAQYAYRHRLNKENLISLGTGLGFQNKNLDGTKLVYEDSNDPNGIFTQTNRFAPTMEFGVQYIYKDYTGGISYSHVLRGKKGADFFKNPRHFFMFANYKYKFNEKINIFPAIFVKSMGIKTQYEFNGMAVYDEKFWGGLTVRPTEAFILLFGTSFVKSDRKYEIGYSYDFDLGKMKSYSGGSHEILLRVTLIRPKINYHYYKTPRLFN